MKASLLLLTVLLTSTGCGPGGSAYGFSETGDGDEGDPVDGGEGEGESVDGMLVDTPLALDLAVETYPKGPGSDGQIWGACLADDLCWTWDGRPLTCVHAPLDTDPFGGSICVPAADSGTCEDLGLPDSPDTETVIGLIEPFWCGLRCKADHPCGGGLECSEIKGLCVWPDL